jgi:hypothetical protein
LLEEMNFENKNQIEESKPSLKKRVASPKGEVG